MRSLMVLAILSVSLVSCRSEAEGAARRSAEFEVVGEGSASGVTSTIGGTGTAVESATLSTTNVDTTTAFSVLNDPNVFATTTTATTLGGQLPPVDGTAVYRRAPPRSAPASNPIRIERTSPAPSAPAPVERTEQRPAEREETEQQEPAETEQPAEAEPEESQPAPAEPAEEEAPPAPPPPNPGAVAPTGSTRF